MSCLVDTIKDKIVNNATSYKITGNEVFIPITKDRTKEQTYKIASGIVSKLNSEYNSKKFGNVVSLNTSLTDGTGIKIHPSKTLEKAYEVKNKEASINEVNSIFMQEGNQYFVDGEVYPTYEDAISKELKSPINKSIELTENQIFEETERYKDIFKRHGIDVIFTQDSNQTGGSVQKLSANKFKITLGSKNGIRFETIAHELSHIYIDALGYNSPIVQLGINKAKKDFPKLWAYIQSKYNDLYEGDKEELEKELLVHVIGKEGDKDFNQSWIDYIKRFFDKISKFLGTSDNIAKELWEDIKNESFKTKLKVENSYKTEKRLFDDKKSKEQAPESAFEKQTVFFKRRIATLSKKLKELDKTSPKYNEIAAELDTLKKRLEQATESQDSNDFKSLGEDMLSRAEEFISQLEQDRKSVSNHNLEFTINTLAAFKDFTGLRDRSSELFNRLYPILSKNTLELINKYKTENFEITEEMLDAQNQDISVFSKSVGSLSDLANYIGRTIGSIIKAAQNRASTKNKYLKDEVESKVKALETWAKSNGKKLQDVYDMIIEETDNDFKLISKYSESAEAQKKYSDLFKPNNKPLLEFYQFYLKTLQTAQDNLPYKIGKYSIPNIAKSDMLYKVKNILKGETIYVDQFKSTEELHADIVPDKYRAKIDKDKKSLDLGSSILEFTAYSNFHNELSQALPEVRLLQEQLKYKKVGNDIAERKFIKASDPNTFTSPESTNLYKMIDAVIDMQLKGNMSKNQFTPFKTKKIKDKDGNIIEYKQVRVEDVVDKALKYNSLLRIGLSPITAISNVLFGDISNAIEGIGGRYYTVKNLKDATNIFFKQINFNPNAEKKSDLYQWLERLNPLQELDDYNLSDKVKLDKMSTEKAMEYMYSMQKKGELFLQSRTMIAILIKEGYMNNKGETTEAGKNLTERELEQLSDKIQRVNQLIHGRYSQREAATLQQSVVYRAMIQFRKWIPSAVEARIGEKQYDNRLGMEIEGRYRTLARLVVSKDVFNNLIKMSKGELSELEMYNMKKNLTELTLLAASIVGYAMLFGGDDDEDKEMRKNPYVKTVLTLLNRVSGDLEFFYNPSEINRLTQNAFPISKTTQDLIKAIQYLPHALYLGDWKIKHGGLKGSNKFYSAFSKIMIGFKPIQDIEKLINENPLDEFN